MRNLTKNGSSIGVILLQTQTDIQLLLNKDNHLKWYSAMSLVGDPIPTNRPMEGFQGRVQVHTPTLLTHTTLIVTINVQHRY